MTFIVLIISIILLFWCDWLFACDGVICAGLLLTTVFSVYLDAKWQMVTVFVGAAVVLVVGGAGAVSGSLAMHWGQRAAVLTMMALAVIPLIRSRRSDMERERVTRELELNLSKIDDFKRVMLSMMEDSRLYQEKLRETNEALETKVLERTRDLEDQKNDLERINLELDSFVYTASHDLRTPLRAISSFAGILDRKYATKLDEPGRTLLRDIKAGAKRLSQLINDLLTLSRLSRIQNPYESVVIAEIVGNVMARIDQLIKESNATIVVDESLPEIVCDRIKIAEVFVNLIDNAIKFSSKCDDRLSEVRISYARVPEGHRFSVSDNGIGIAPRHAGQIFEIFSRLHRDDEYEGTGAGLSIVRRIVEGHGGKIWLESDVGKGTTFHFTIPPELHDARRVSQGPVANVTESPEVLDAGGAAVYGAR